MSLEHLFELHHVDEARGAVARPAGALLELSPAQQRERTQHYLEWLDGRAEIGTDKAEQVRLAQLRRAALAHLDSLGDA